MYVFHHIWEVLSISSFFLFLSFSPYSVTSIMRMLIPLMVPHMSLRFCSFSFVPYFFWLLRVDSFNCPIIKFADLFFLLPAQICCWTLPEFLMSAIILFRSRFSTGFFLYFLSIFPTYSCIILLIAFSLNLGFFH